MVKSKKQMSEKIKKIFAVSILFLSFAPLFPQNSDIRDELLVTKDIRTAEEGLAYEEFRRGIQAFYRGSYNDSVLQFEKALGYTPEDNRILEWLGKAYYYSGLEGTALQEWERCSSLGWGGLLLKNKIEIVKERRFSFENDAIEALYTEAGSYPGFYKGNMIFSEPVSALANNNGTFWVLCYGSNELLLLNINGSVIDRITGPLNGFDHPLDMIRLSSGNILVSEVSGNRLCLLDKKGHFVKYIGKKGRQTGELLGPQYLAEDFRGNIYVSDYGNRRVAVFDREGNGLFSFGSNAKGEFPGLRGPTGIAVISDSVFVCDDLKGIIYEFDLSGNFRKKVVLEKTFKRPESMKVWSDYLVVADSNKIISVDTLTGEIYENINSGNAPSRLTCAVPDVNGNILVTDFKANEVYVMSKMQELVGGLFLQIEKVDSSRFPEVQLDVKVESRSRNSIVGLKENNFYITEDKRPVSKLKFLGSASDNDYADITLVIDRSMTMKDESSLSLVENAVKDIVQDMGGKGVLRILSAGLRPANEYTGNPENERLFSSKALKTPFSSVVPLDLAFRLAANELVNAAKKRAIIFITDGKVTQHSFDKYSLAETASYLNNNSVILSAIYLNQEGISEETEYLVNNTKGKSYYVFQEEGLSSVISDIVDLPQGNYSFSYVSAMQTNFGEKFLPVEVEAYLMNRSGRDETGYFAPLQ